MTVRTLQTVPSIRPPRYVAAGSATFSKTRADWLGALAVVLLGYALFGKGWAYVGVPPLFIGEILLAVGLFSLLFLPRWLRLFELAPACFLLALSCWGLYRTLPYVRVYGIDALRDAVIFAYGSFAFIVAAFIVASPPVLRRLLGYYRRFATLFLFGIPFVWLANRYLGDAIPTWPWADVPVVHAKGGDVLVHVSGILAFWIAGFAGNVGRPRTFLMAGCVALMGAYNRGGLLSFLAAFGVCVLLRPQALPARRLIGAGLAGLALLAITNVQIQLPGKNREVSFLQLVENVASVAGDSDAGDLDGTKQWRLNWWRDIADYTLSGPYFWKGKGFGVNLAEDDGYQVMADDSLRSPHNGHLNILARAGVPGFALWVLVQLSWAGALFAAHLKSQRERDANWSGLFLFLLVYWVAFMANTTFDVFIEGPMGGIWFWSVYGVGLGALWTYRNQPDVLRLPSRSQPHPVI